MDWVVGCWSELVDRLCDSWSSSPPDPFQSETVLVSSTGVGRVLAQSLALRIGAGQGICAGVDFLTIGQFQHRLMRDTGIAEKADPWRPTPLAFEIRSQLETLLERPAFAAVAHHLGSLHDEHHPTRWLNASIRFANVLLNYANQLPHMLRQWSVDVPVDPDGRTLGPSSMWQYELWRALTASIEAPSPVHRLEILADKAMSAGQIQLFAPANLNSLDKEFLQTLSSRARITGYLVDRPDRSVQPTFNLHPSHGVSRQVEVLRDVLCGIFIENPELEPRDVVICCPDLPGYAPTIDAVFNKDAGHPGAQLRVQLPQNTGRPGNEVLELLIELLRLPHTRAATSDLVKLCSRTPVANRFGFSQGDISRIAELLEQANVRWGIDLTHRQRHFDLPFAQNTWLSGLDQLLAGLAMSGQEIKWLGTVMPNDAASTTDADLLGSLAELISRIRRFCHLSSAPLEMAQWAGLLGENVPLFIRLDTESTWMTQQVWGWLADLTDQLRPEAQRLNRLEMACILEGLGSSYHSRSGHGNGSLMVITPEDLPLVPHRVVCLLGIESFHPDESDADSLPLPDSAHDRFWQVLDSCQDQAVVIYQGADEQSGRKTTRPVLLDLAVTRAEEKGWTIALAPQHSLHPFSEAELAKDSPFSFDERMLATARAKRNPAVTRSISSPIPEISQIQLSSLVALLHNPVKFFLTHRLGLVPEDEQPPRAGIPLDVRGLDRWTIGQRMLSLVESGHDTTDVMQAEWRRGTVAPGEIGRVVLESIGKEVSAIASHTAVLRDTDSVENQVRITVGQRTISGNLTIWDQRMVTSTFSRTDGKAWISAWLQALLAGAAQLNITRSHVVGSPDWSAERDILFTERVIEVPKPERALSILSGLLKLHDESLDRPAPLPFEIALPYAQSRRRSRTPISSQQVMGRYRRKWDRMVARNWEEFYPSFQDLLAVQPRTSSATSRFAELAEYVYLPMIEHTQVIQHG